MVSKLNIDTIVLCLSAKNWAWYSVVHRYFGMHASLFVPRDVILQRDNALVRLSRTTLQKNTPVTDLLK